MEDLRNVPIQVVISADKKTIWVNDYGCCILRAQNIPQLNIEELK